MDESSGLLRLPRELRDMIYGYTYKRDSDDVYISYHTSWSTNDRVISRERSISLDLSAALSLNGTCQQTHAETEQFLSAFQQSPRVHIRLTRRDDAKEFKFLLWHIAQRYPHVRNLIVTLNISGEHTYCLSYIPTALPDLEILRLEVIDKLHCKQVAQNILLDADALANASSKGCSVYRDRALGKLKLTQTRHYFDRVMKSGEVANAYVLKFEKDDYPRPQPLQSPSCLLKR